MIVPQDSFSYPTVEYSGVEIDKNIDVFAFRNAYNEYLGKISNVYSSEQKDTITKALESTGIHANQDF